MKVVAGMNQQQKQLRQQRLESPAESQLTMCGLNDAVAEEEDEVFIVSPPTNNSRRNSATTMHFHKCDNRLCSLDRKSSFSKASSPANSLSSYVTEKRFQVNRYDPGSAVPAHVRFRFRLDSPSIDYASSNVQQQQQQEQMLKRPRASSVNTLLTSSYDFQKSKSPFTYIETTSIKKQQQQQLAAPRVRVIRSPLKVIRVRQVDQRSSPNHRSPSSNHHHHHGKQTHKTVLFTRLSCSPNRRTNNDCFIDESNRRNEFEKNDLKSFEREVESVYRRVDALESVSFKHRTNGSSSSSSSAMRQRLENLEADLNNARNESNNYLQNVNLVKVYIGLLENASKWIAKTEDKLCNQESLSTVIQLPSVIRRLLYELEEIQSFLKSKQEDINKIRNVTDKILTNKARIRNDISNLNEILDAGEEIKQRYKEIFVQISDREALLRDIHQAYESYENSHKSESKWIKLLKNQIDDHERKQAIYKQQKIELRKKYQSQQSTIISNMDDDINELKSSFDPVAKIFTELGSRSNQIENLNEIGILLIKLLRRYNQLLVDYRLKSKPDSPQLHANSFESSQTILNQLRQELNTLNREYAGLLNEYNQKVKTLTNSIAQSDKHFTVHITFQNAEPLIEKYNQDLFERYELIRDYNNYNYQQTLNNTTNSNFRNSTSSLQQQQQQQQVHSSQQSLYINNNNSTSSTTTANNSPRTVFYNYYYYDTGNKNLMNLMMNNNHHQHQQQQQGEFVTPTMMNQSFTNLDQLSTSTMSSSSSSAVSSSSSRSSRPVYPLSFIDSVNRKQLDLESGLFKEPNLQTYSLNLADAIKLGLLNAKSAFVVDTSSNRAYDLTDAINLGLINAKTNRVNIQTTNANKTTSLSLADALKTGYLKIGESSTSTLGSIGVAGPSISSETQSMSVKSIKDPSTNEFLAPTEAIKRKLLDPYKGVFVNSLNGERMPISEAIQKGYVLVEMISNVPIVNSTSRHSTHAGVNGGAGGESNIVSTSLIRETKSYHLLGVYDPLKNDEITIKEAIARGILDRQRGLYVHPQTKEAFSISDAINKGVIRARILTPPPGKDSDTSSSSSYQTLISSNRFEENRSYTICAAIDPRTNKRITLTQAIRDGIIDAKNGTYVNIVTGEVISINKAIECRLVLTAEPGTEPQQQQQPKRPTSKSPVTRREVKTLNIEFVKDPRTGRNISVSEAMQTGLLDRHSLNYNNPITNECLSLNKAHERGYIIGHYTDSLTNDEIRSTTTTTNRYHHKEESYFIIDILDPRVNKSVTLDEAIHTGLFDHSRGVYIHPISKETISIGDAIRKGFVNAKIFDDETSKRYDTRLPVGDFGIDKKIKSMRTKFNKDGTSVLQIDIECTKPTKGIYEVDEIEEFTINETQLADQRQSLRPASYDGRREISQVNREIRQVVDINSVHRVNDEETESQRNALLKLEPTTTTNIIKEKNVLKVEINKELGADLKIRRFEDVIDDETDHHRRHTSGIIRINVDNNNNTKNIPERKAIFEQSEHVQTLVIDDGNQKNARAVHIDGQTHVNKKEVLINEPKRVDVITHTQKSVEELNRKLEILKSEQTNQVKVKTAEIVDQRVHRKSAHLDLDDGNRFIEKNVKITFDISEEKPKEGPRQVKTIVDEEKKVNNRVIYEDSYVIEHKTKRGGVDEEEESFEEWTEVYTITVRGIRYKIIWVYDALKNERVTLVEGINRGIIDIKKNVYHNLKTSYSSTINEAVDDGLIGIEEDTSALTIKVNGITYTIYWLWDPVKQKRISPKRAIERGVLDLENLVYRNYSNDQTISIHEAVYMKLIGASDDLSNIEEELTLEIENVKYKIAWVRDSRSGEKYKPRDALRHGLLDLTHYFYNKYDTNQSLSIPEAVDLNFIGLSEVNRQTSSSSEDEYDENGRRKRKLNRQDSLLSLDDEELTIKTKTAIYVITGLLHPETQKEIKVSEAIKQGILDKENGSYKDFKTNVIYDVGEAINEGIVFATVTDLLQDETASTEYIREEIKKFIVRSVIDPRTNEKIGGLQAQAAGILNYAQGMYTNPDTNHNIPISEAIERNFIQVQLQEETAHEEFDAEVVTETLMERCVTNYRILGVLDPFTNEFVSASEAVHRQIIDTETNAYVDASTHDEPVPIKEAVRRNLIKAQVSEHVERKPLGLTLQNAMRLGLFNPENGRFKDLYTNKYYDLNQAIEKGHINPNGAAVSDSATGAMTLNEAFSYSIFNKKTGIIDRNRLNQFKGRIVDSKIFKWNFEDAVKCGIINLKTGKYKHQSTTELLSIKDAINRGLIDGESTIIENPITNSLVTLKQALDTIVRIDDTGNVLDLNTNKLLNTLENAFNTRKIISMFDENTGEIFLSSLGKIVPFEKAIRKKKMDKSVRIFDPKSNRDLSINDAIERAIIDKTSGMIIDPKGCGGLLSIKEAVKRGIVSVTGAPVVTGHHNSETIETPTITSRKTRHHLMQKFDDVFERNSLMDSRVKRSHHSSKSSALKSQSLTKTPIVYDGEYLQSDLIKHANLPSDPSLITSIKTTNEEHRKKISGDSLIESVKADFKETVIEPGKMPKVTSSANYEKEHKTNLHSPSSDSNLQREDNNSQTSLVIRRVVIKRASNTTSEKQVITKTDEFAEQVVDNDSTTQSSIDNRNE